MKKETSTPKPNQLYRSETNRMIGGVAGGLGEYFNIDPTIVRIIFIILTLLHGSGLLIYILMWILIPSESQINETSPNTVKNNVEEIKKRTQSFAHSLRFKNTHSQENSRFWWAILIIALGFFFLFRNFGIFDALELGRFWPMILIIVGLIFLLRK